MEMLLTIPLTVGKKALKIWSGIRDFGRYFRSIAVSFKSLRYLRFRSLYGIVINQTRFTGIDALNFVVIIALIIGATVIIQAMTNLPKFGTEGFIGNILVIIVARELGPLITALIVISRSGSAIAAEISTQKQNQEILSMEIMGIDTRLYIVFPRIVASILSIFSLIVIFDLTAFIGGFVIARSTVYMAPETFLQTLIDAFSLKDLLATMIKSIIYGILVPLICCYYGFKAASQFEVPIFVSRAVIRTLFTVIVVNVIISILFYF